MPHLLELIAWGECGVLLLLGSNLYRRWRNPTTQQPELKYVIVEHCIYFAIAAIVIVILNNSGVSASAKEVFGLKSGDLTEMYCFSSVGLSSASITKNILGSALS